MPRRKRLSSSNDVPPSDRKTRGIQRSYCEPEITDFEVESEENYKEKEPLHHSRYNTRSSKKQPFTTLAFSKRGDPLDDITIHGNVDEESHFERRKLSKIQQQKVDSDVQSYSLLSDSNVKSQSGVDESGNTSEEVTSIPKTRGRKRSGRRLKNINNLTPNNARKRTKQQTMSSNAYIRKEENISFFEESRNVPRRPGLRTLPRIDYKNDMNFSMGRKFCNKESCSKDVHESGPINRKYELRRRGDIRYNYDTFDGIEAKANNLNRSDYVSSSQHKFPIPAMNILDRIRQFKHRGEQDHSDIEVMDRHGTSSFGYKNMDPAFKPINISTDNEPVSLVSKPVKFEDIGGLSHHVRSLKEMILLPLLYPELYSQFGIKPPRGVLFHGPPGTGKTLVARALASQFSTSQKKVAFFMRKGADCLSKWVGEAERQLRLLFEEAKKWQPSIIFFDELDGLAPVRSSKQEQIYSSIVSTLLALMDGLDDRGQVVVIGATNRIDSIDPALRRPGRFDREFLFPLPSKKSRREIIEIVTKRWDSETLSSTFKDNLAEMTSGYCGADIESLATEATLKAIRRTYPQIYSCSDKLLIDPKTIRIRKQDFMNASKDIIPSSKRAASVYACPLRPEIHSLLHIQLEAASQIVNKVFPESVTGKEFTESDEDMDSDEDADQLSPESLLEKSRLSLLLRGKAVSPRLMIYGIKGMGHHDITGAILAKLERFPVKVFDLNHLYLDSNVTPESACIHIFQEVRRQKPSVLLVPQIDVWWDCISHTVQKLFTHFVAEMTVSDSIFLLASSTCEHICQLSPEILNWFNGQSINFLNIDYPSLEQRREFFSDILSIAKLPPSLIGSLMSVTKKDKRKKEFPQLPKAPIAPLLEKTPEQLREQQKHDDYVFRELRICLRDVLDQVLKERKFKPFFKLEDENENPDYYLIIQQPMDITKMIHKVNQHAYRTVNEFVEDIDLIVSNTEMYYGQNDPNKMFYRVKSLQDMTLAMIAHFSVELLKESEQSAKRYYDQRRKKEQKKEDALPISLEIVIEKANPCNLDHLSRDTPPDSFIDAIVDNGNQKKGTVHPEDHSANSDEFSNDKGEEVDRKSSDDINPALVTPSTPVPEENNDPSDGKGEGINKENIQSVLITSGELQELVICEEMMSQFEQELLQVTSERTIQELEGLKSSLWTSMMPYLGEWDRSGLPEKLLKQLRQQ